MAIQSLAANPFPGIAALTLIAAFYLQAYSCSLGSASRSYYAAPSNSKLPEAMSPQHNNPIHRTVSQLRSLKPSGRTEPPRLSRRLQLLRRWSHEEIIEVLT